MTYVVNFDDFVPPARHDLEPWIEVRIDEAPTADTPVGQWIAIDTQALSPLDSDPANPVARSFTTNRALLQNGWYNIVFLDGSGHPADPLGPVHNISTALRYAPTVTQVAAELLSRTVDRYGNLLGTFTDETTPNVSQVISYIDAAAGELSLKIGDNIPEDLVDEASTVAALNAAMRIELGLFPEQQANDRSPYKLLEERYDKLLLNLQKAVTEAEQGGDVLDTGPSNRPSWSFPPKGPITMGRIW